LNNVVEVAAGRQLGGKTKARVKLQGTMRQSYHFGKTFTAPKSPSGNIILDCIAFAT